MKTSLPVTALALWLLAMPLAADSPPAPQAATTPPATEIEQAEAEPADPADALLSELEATLRQAPDDLQLGNRYRQAVIAAEAYERSIPFFEQLVEDHPQSANAFLNLGYALVDKIPVEGAITQVLLANSALGHFSTALELEETWLVRFTRGNSYLYWPPIFGRTRLGMDDLERALELLDGQPRIAPHARVWMALGDGHWRLDDLEQARAAWQQGLERFPDDADLEHRLALDDEGLAAFFDEYFDPGMRVDTDLSAMEQGQGQEPAP